MDDKEIQPLPKGCYVMLHIGTGPALAHVKAGASLVVTDERPKFFLNDDIWIERLDEELAKHVQIACEPPNYNIGNRAYDRHLYAFVAQISKPGTETQKYEGMGKLRALAALSRLLSLA
jgi:hypothetical protein